MKGLGQLQQASSLLADADVAGLSDDDLGDALLVLHREQAQLAAVCARVTGEFDARGAFRADGSKTAAAWLGRHTRTSRGRCRRQVRLARQLGEMPHTSAALAAGEIDEQHARALAEVAGSRHTAVAEGFVDEEKRLVDEAKTRPFGEFMAAVRTFEQTADDDGAEQDAAARRAARRVSLTQTKHGDWHIRGFLDAVSGTEVATALRRLDHQLFEQDWSDAKAIHGDDTTAEHLARTTLQRRADALVDLARRAMAAPAGARLPAPLVTVLVGYETFAGRTCKLADGTVLTPGQIVPLLTDADIERAVFDGPDRIIGLGVRNRLFSGGLRRVIEIRDSHCQFPGCDTPFDECHVDHIVPYSQGGPTTQDNGRIYCPSHNRHRNHHEHPAPHGDDP